MRVAGKKILIISGGAEALPIIERARDMGLYVAVSDGDRDAPGFALAHEAIVASTYDAGKTLRLARASDADKSIDGVISAAADVPLTVAVVAEGLGLPGPSVASARLASDKFLMKKAFQKMGVPVPWFAMVKSVEELRSFVKKKSKKIVIKPVDSRGARGVIRITEGMDLNWVFYEAKKNSPSGRVMLEEWLEGPQISTESVVSGGQVATPGLSERNYEYLDRFSPFVIENGGDLPARLGPGELRAVNKVILDAARAFGIDNWTIKGDIVMRGGIPFVIEAATRLSGGYFCTHTIPLSTGIDIARAAILLALGVKLKAINFNPLFRKNVSQRFWFPKPGVVKQIERAPKLDGMAGLEKITLNVKEGDILSPVVSHPGRAGMVITTGASREEAVARARAAIESVKIITEKKLRMAL